MRDVREVLNICIESPYWDAAYEKAIAEPEVPVWLTEAYIRDLHAEKGVLPRHMEDIVGILPHVTCVPALCVLAKVFYHLIGLRKKFSEVFTKFELPLAPEGTKNTIGYDCFAIFPVIAHIEPTWEILKARGVSEDILTASLHWADTIFHEASEKVGKPIFHTAQFRAYSVAVYVNHLTIGCLRFEIHENSLRPVRIYQNKAGTFCALLDNVRLHRSGHILGTFGATDEEGAYAANFVECEDAYEGYSLDADSRLAVKKRVRLLKSEWTQVYGSGDTALKVHIPYGARISKEGCADAYKRAREVFTRCFPEYKFQCFLICCWMLSPLLREILPQQSNILAFQSDFEVYPMLNQATDAFLYVYQLEVKSPGEVLLAELPENNTMQRGVKQKALEGRFVYQFGGYIPF